VWKREENFKEKIIEGGKVHRWAEIDSLLPVTGQYYTATQDTSFDQIQPPFAL
jgi:hypothetical protein